MCTSFLRRWTRGGPPPAIVVATLGCAGREHGVRDHRHHHLLLRLSPKLQTSPKTHETSRACFFPSLIYPLLRPCRTLTERYTEWETKGTLEEARSTSGSRTRHCRRSPRAVEPELDDRPNKRKAKEPRAAASKRPEESINHQRERIVQREDVRRLHLFTVFKHPVTFIYKRVLPHHGCSRLGASLLAAIRSISASITTAVALTT